MVSMKNVLLTAVLGSSLILFQNCMADEFDDWVQEYNQQAAKNPEDIDAPLSDKAKAEIEALNEEAVHGSTSGVSEKSEKK